MQMFYVSCLFLICLINNAFSNVPAMRTAAMATSPEIMMAPSADDIVGDGIDDNGECEENSL